MKFSDFKNMLGKNQDLDAIATSPEISNVAMQEIEEQLLHSVSGGIWFAWGKAF